MTVSEASATLQKPVFGDERCIAARKLLELADELRRARVECYASAWGNDWPAVESMSGQDVRSELQLWREAAGWPDDL